MLMTRVFGGFKRKPGDKLLARWRVDADEWRQFVASESRRQGAQAESEMPPKDEGVPEGVEIVVEPHAVWIAGQRASLPLRGLPEVLSAKLEEAAGSPTTIELSLKYPAYSLPSGRVVPARYTRLAVPLPRSAWREAKTVVAHFNRDVPGTPDFFHGRGDGTDPEDMSRCWTCGHESHKFRSECERCGASLQSRRWSRRFGAVLTVCGLFISALIGLVLYSMLPLLLHPGVSRSGTRFDGSAGMAAGVLLVFVLVLAFGATITGYGVWQVLTGQRSKKVVGVMMALFTAMMGCGLALVWWFD